MLTRFFAIASLLMLAACASGNMRSQSRVQTQEVLSLKKIFISLNVESRNFNKVISSSLQQSLISSLAQCGVSAKIYVKDPLDIKPEMTYTKALMDFQPDATLSIVRTGGQVVISGDTGSARANFDVMLRLSKISPKVEVWTAQTDVAILTGNMFVNDSKTGERIGVKFFELMKKDGIVCRG